MKKRSAILITGGAGFIGSHVTELFLAAEWDVIILDDLSSGKRENIPRHPRLKLIVNNSLALAELTPNLALDAVLHLSAQASVQKSWQFPRHCHDANLTATLEVLEFCRRLNIPRAVMASSAAVYGSDPELPIHENLRCRPISPYGLQKLASEEYGRVTAERYGLTVVALRLFNVFGPRQAFDSPYSGVISRFRRSLDQGEDITIYGDGLQTRDFVYVKDVAAAFFLAVTKSMKPGNFLAANVGTGRGRSLLELVKAMAESFPDWQGQVNHLEGRPGDIRDSVADNKVLKETLDWGAKWSFEQGLKDYLAPESNFNSVFGDRAPRAGVPHPG